MNEPNLNNNLIQISDNFIISTEYYHTFGSLNKCLMIRFGTNIFSKRSHKKYTIFELNLNFKLVNNGKMQSLYKK